MYLVVLVIGRLSVRLANSMLLWTINMYSKNIHKDGINYRQDVMNRLLGPTTSDPVC